MKLKVNSTFNKSTDTGYEVIVNIDELIDAIIASDKFDDLADEVIEYASEQQPEQQG